MRDFLVVSCGVFLFAIAFGVLVSNIERIEKGCDKVVYFDYLALGLSRLSCEVK